MEPVFLYNSLSRNIDTFTAIRPGAVGMYCCGPTVYNYQHIGNLRTFIFEDVLARLLRRAGYDVRHVMNITDVGHLVSDADEGEDKMAVAARREGKKSEEIAAYYTEVFFEHCSWLNIKRPDVVCRATDHISEMIELISMLESRGFAYQAGGNIYFDVEKFSRYGDLAKLDLENLRAGARIEVDSSKHSPLDFALWFTNSKFAEQEMQWDSPWGRGYPGWHIECSAMARKYLGNHFDIHCGGIDHIPVHHTNEIAQSECATGEKFANFWLHGGFLTAGKTGQEKMSKSTGEFLTLNVVKERGFEPIAYRLFCLAGNYRRELSWSWEGLAGAQKSLEKLRLWVLEAKARATGELPPLNCCSSLAQNELKDFNNAVFYDLGIPKALAVVHRIANSDEIPPEEKLALLFSFDDVLGLSMREWQGKCAEDIPLDVLALAEQRQEARQKKDWAAADCIRSELEDLGYVVRDTPDGAKLEKLR